MKFGIHPNVISYLSVVSAAGAGLCFLNAGVHSWLLLLGPVLCVFRLWCNMLDGMVAIASNKACRKGEIFNDLPDRVSDVLIFVGIAHSGLCNPFLAYWVAIMSLLTAYVGTLGQAVGVKREFGGVMSKPSRMVVVMLAAFVLFGLQRTGNTVTWNGWTVFDFACGIVILGCLQTIWVRLVSTLAGLQNSDESEPPNETS